MNRRVGRRPSQASWKPRSGLGAELDARRSAPEFGGERRLPASSRPKRGRGGDLARP